MDKKTKSTANYFILWQKTSSINNNNNNRVAMADTVPSDMFLPREIQISPGSKVSSCGQLIAHAQADLSLSCAHMSEGTKSDMTVQ